jgi:hypothetical protein
MPRLLGVVLLALGLIMVQIIRHRVEALYLTTLGVRVVIIVGLAGLFVYSQDPPHLTDGRRRDRHDPDGHELPRGSTPPRDLTELARPIRPA